MAMSVLSMPGQKEAAEATALSPVYGFLKAASMVDFPEHLAAVFFTSGCNFGCGYCHNHGNLGVRKPGLSWERLEQVCADFREQWIDGVVITGGEPTLWPELPQLVRLFKEFGFEIKLDTNGSSPEMLELLLPQVDYVAMDIKCALARYPEFVGCAKTESIAKSVALLKAGATAYEFRTTVLEDIHTKTEMAAIGDWIQGALSYVLQPFVPRPDLPDPALRQAARCRPEHLRDLAAVVAGRVDEVVVRGA